MKLDVILDSRTFREFTIFDILYRRKYWRSPVIFASILAGCSLVSFLMYRIDGAVLLGCVLLVIGLGMPVVYFLSFFLNLKTVVDNQKLGKGKKVYSLELDNAAIKVSNEKEKAEYQWQDAYMAYRNYDAIYLFITPERGFILPSPQESQDIIWALVEKKMKGRTKVLSSRKKNGREWN